MKCQFLCLDKGSRCERCGYILKRDYTKAPIKNCRNAVDPLDCPHLLNPTDESVQVFGCGCKSETVLTTVWGCALHGRCSPMKRGKSLSDPTVKRCIACGDNPAMASSAEA